MAVTTDPLKTGLADLLNPSFTTVTVSGLTAGRVVYTGTGGLLSASANFTFDGTNAVLAETVFMQKPIGLLNVMAEPGTIGNRSQIYVDGADGLLKLKDGAGVVKQFVLL